MKKIFNIAVNTFLALVILGVPGVFLAQHYGLMGRVEMKIVRSGSMTPAIPTGSLVFDSPAKSYHLGDVITFGADTKTAVPTTHRIVSVRQENGVNYFTTKGDANDAADPGETPQSKVIGKVVFHLPYAGYVLAFAKTKLGFALMVALPAALIILNELLGIVTEVKRIRKKKTLTREAAQSARTFPRKRNLREMPSGLPPRAFDIGVRATPREQGPRLREVVAARSPRMWDVVRGASAKSLR